MEILSFMKLMFAEYLLYALPDFSSQPHCHHHDLSPLSLSSHISKEEQNREGKRRAGFSVTSEKTPWCALATGARSVMSPLSKDRGMVKQGQTDISVRDRRTNTELPVVARLGEAVWSKLQDSVSFPGFCRWERGGR